MDRLQVKNWRELQVYKDRTPPWIRLYRKLLSDREFIEELPDVLKWPLIGIWLFAAETLEGTIPFDEKQVRFQLHIKSEKPFLQPLIDAGWLIVQNDTESYSSVTECRSNGLTPRNDTPETETETEADTEQRERQNGLTASVCVSAWNDMAEQTGLAKCKTMGTKRTKNFSTRRKEPYFCEHILEAIQAVPKLGKFYLGGGDGDWRIHFDFLLQPDRVAQIIEKTEAPTSRPPEPGVFVREDNFDIGDDDA